MTEIDKTALDAHQKALAMRTPIGWRWRYDRMGDGQPWHFSTEPVGPFVEDGYRVEALALFNDLDEAENDLDRLRAELEAAESRLTQAVTRERERDVHGHSVWLVLEIELGSEDERPAIFSTYQAACEWCDRDDGKECAHVVSQFVVDVPEFGNEAQEQQG